MRKLLLLIAAGLLAFGWSLRGSFHFDDYSLTENPLITSASGLWRMWGPFETRPLANLTFWVNYHLGGANAIGYHAVNLALHAAAVILLYRALQLLILETAAFWGALIFAIHPIQSEAVCYVFARSTLLSTLFCLATLWCFLRGRARWAITLFACALFSKEECITFPLVLLLVTKRSVERSRQVTFMLMLALFAGTRAILATVHTAGSGAGFTSGVSPVDYLVPQGSAILRYMRLVVVPWGFTIEPTISLSSWLLYAASWAAILAFVGLSLWAFRKRYTWAVWALSGLILLIPSSTIFPAADFAADRRMYLPMVAFAAGSGVIASWLRVPIPQAAAVVLLVLSVARAEVWRTEEKLWREAVQRSPQHVRPLMQLARVMPPEDAVELLNRAKALEPSNALVASELGRTWLQSGNYAFALQEFGRALALKPNDPNALNNRGATLLALKQNRAAKLDFERALGIDPCSEAARRNLQSLGLPPRAPCSVKAK